MKKARVLREYPISDHRLITIRMRNSMKVPNAMMGTEKMKINVDVC